MVPEQDSTFDVLERGMWRDIGSLPLTAALLLLPVACPAPLSPARLPTREAGFSLSQSRTEATARFGWLRCVRNANTAGERKMNGQSLGKALLPVFKVFKSTDKAGVRGEEALGGASQFPTHAACASCLS